MRIFTRDKARADKGEALKAFQEEVEAKVKSTDLSQFQKAPDIIYQKKIRGKRDGAVMVFRKNGIPTAYSWKASD